LRKSLTNMHGVCFAGIGSSLPPTESVTNKWGPRPSRRGRSADDSDAADATRHAASLLERRLGPAEAGALSATAASRGRRRRVVALRPKRGERCRDAQPPPVPPAEAQLPKPPGPLPSQRSPPSGGGAPPAATSAAVAGCRGPPVASHRPPLPAAAVVLRVRGGDGGADGRRSDGRPSAAKEAGAPVVHSVGATAGAEGGGGRRAKSRFTRPSAPPNLPPRAQSGRRRRATACPHSVERLGDVYVSPHRRLACRQVGCSGEVAVVLAAVTFGGQKGHEAVLRFVTQKAGHSSVLFVLGDRGINVR